MNLPKMDSPNPLLLVCVYGHKCFEVSGLPSGMSLVLLDSLSACVREYILIIMLVFVIKTLIK